MTGALALRAGALEVDVLAVLGGSIVRFDRIVGTHRQPLLRGADTVIDTEVVSAWTIDAAVLPVDNVPATGRYDLRARRICGQALDNGFDGWSGTASIAWPGEAASLRLSSPDAGRFQVYSPVEGGLFVAEPVQNANVALNARQAEWAGLGITLLEQGQESIVHARFDVVVS